MKRDIMSRIFLAVVLCILIVLSMSACESREYEVTFILGDGRDNVTAKVTSGNLNFSPDPPSEEYVFGGWFLDADLTRPYLSENIRSDMTLYARFVKRGEKVVTFVYDNGTADTTLVMSGALMEPPEPSKAGYVFLGWIDAATGERYGFGVEPTAQHTVLRASWRVSLGSVELTVNPCNGEASSTKNLLYNATPSVPETPIRDGYTFLGWYSDADCTRLFDFDKALKSDASIYAGWVVDSSSLGNGIAVNMLKSTVKINAKHYNNGIFGTTSGVVSLGSGVIYAELDGYYYVLTNHHVVEGDERYNHTDYYVYDAYGNEYTAALMAADSAYDLAVLKLQKGEKALCVAELDTVDPGLGELLVSVGNPGGLINSVTYGELMRYGNVEIVDGSDVTFAVGWHKAPLDHGSSGGAVFNSEMKVVGINFASGTTTSGESIGAFIQISRVREFLYNHSLINP